MRILPSFFIIISVSAEAPSGVASRVAKRAQRESCPYWKAVGILSDHIELACGGERVLELIATEKESPALACCPEPYNRCSQAERVSGCDAIVAPILTASGATASKESWVTALQRARGALLAADERCSVLAPEEPHAKCNGELIGGRDDIYCEMMLFQTEQLGDGDPSEYKQLGCAFPGKDVQAAGEKKGGAMLRSLMKSDVPDVWMGVEDVSSWKSSWMAAKLRDVSLLRKGGDEEPMTAPENE